MELRSYSEILPEDPEWLWLGRIPRSELTIVAGAGGVGKGMLTADLAARVTRGAEMPDGADGQRPGSVILVSVEDSPEMSMTHRLRAAGAVLSKVYDFSGRDFRVPDSLPALREAIEQIGDVRMVVVDPLSAVSSIPITSGNVRIRHQLMNPLEDLAQETGVSLVAIHHLVKSGRTAGSKAITDTARQVLRVDRASDERIRIVSVEKSNIAADSAPEVAYTIDGEFPDTRVFWINRREDRELTTAERILAVLEDAAEPLETQVISKLSGVSYQQCRTALTRLKDRRKVMQPKRGLWATASAVELLNGKAG